MHTIYHRYHLENRKEEGIHNTNHVIAVVTPLGINYLFNFLNNFPFFLRLNKSRFQLLFSLCRGSSGMKIEDTNPSGDFRLTSDLCENRIILIGHLPYSFVSHYTLMARTVMFSNNW